MNFNPLKRILFLALICTLFGCGSDPAALPAKDLFSIWESENFAFDLRSSDFSSTSAVDILHYSGALCTCAGQISGDQREGFANLASCTYSGGGSGNPGCGSLDNGGRAYSYIKAGATLRLCSSETDCVYYQ